MCLSGHAAICPVFLNDLITNPFLGVGLSLLCACVPKGSECSDWSAAVAFGPHLRGASNGED